MRFFLGNLAVPPGLTTPGFRRKGLIRQLVPSLDGKRLLLLSLDERFCRFALLLDALRIKAGRRSAA